MKFNLLLCFTLFSVALVGSHAMTPEAYWKSVLPNTPMPKPIKDLLNTSTELNDGKSTRARVGRGGVAVNSGRPGRGTNTAVGRGGIGVHTGTPGRRTNVGVGRGGIGVGSGRRGRPVSVGLRPGRNPFQYHYAASENQLKDDPNVALFFLENDLHKGREMNLDFRQNEQKVTFLPRKVADSIPFASNNISQIYKVFSIDPASTEAETMKQTLKECEDKGIEGEETHCATSLESMVDFCTTKLGKKVKAISTEVNPKESTSLRKYKINIAKKLAASKAVVCHKESYIYAVFYCHKTVSTRAYDVSMAGADGAKVNAMAVCHTDTGKWNPKHLAFQVLKVKPGSVPICHFLPQDHVVWVPY